MMAVVLRNLYKALILKNIRPQISMHPEQLAASPQRICQMNVIGQGAKGSKTLKTNDLTKQNKE